MDGAEVSTPCEAVSTLEIIVFVPELLNLEIDGSISDPAVIGYAPLVRRDLDVGLRDNSRSALAL